MATADQTAPSGPLSDYMIVVLQTTYGQVAALSVIWGIQIALAVQACYVLWKRGLRTSLSRRLLTAAVLVMLGSSSAFTILYVQTLVFQMPTLGASPPDIGAEIVRHQIAWNWLDRLNYILNDTVVVWRAWALWPGSRPVRATLAVCLTVTWLGLITNSVFMTLGDSGTGTYPSSKQWGLHLQLLFYVPFLVTNVLATTLISYKAWLYRQDIKAYVTDSGTASSKGGTRIDRVFALFIETGIIYTVFWIIAMLADYKVLDKTDPGFVFTSVWQILMIEISGIYPTIIILLVSKYMSQSEVVYTTLHHQPHPHHPHHHSHHPSPDGSDGSRTVQGAVSTMRFVGGGAHLGSSGAVSTMRFGENADHSEAGLKTFDAEAGLKTFDSGRSSVV